MMHQSILAKRKAKAVNQIVWTAGALVKHFEGDPALAQALEPKGVKDPAAAEMMRLESLSDLLLWIALHVGAVKESAPVTAVTEEPEPEPESNPIGEPVPGPALAGLPAPVIEEEPAPLEPKKPTRGRHKK